MRVGFYWNHKSNTMINISETT